MQTKRSLNFRPLVIYNKPAATNFRTGFLHNRGRPAQPGTWLRNYLVDVFPQIGASLLAGYLGYNQAFVYTTALSSLLRKSAWKIVRGGCVLLGVRYKVSGVCDVEFRPCMQSDGKHTINHMSGAFACNPAAVCWVTLMLQPYPRHGIADRRQNKIFQHPPFFLQLFETILAYHGWLQLPVRACATFQFKHKPGVGGQSNLTMSKQFCRCLVGNAQRRGSVAV